jgi:hypothetical protein
MRALSIVHESTGRSLAREFYPMYEILLVSAQYNTVHNAIEQNIFV